MRQPNNEQQTVLAEASQAHALRVGQAESVHEVNLHCWAEDQCNYGESSIDEGYWLRLARATAARFDLKIYHQGDPRGCALYVYSDKDMEGSRYPIQQVYNTRATAIC